MAGFLHRLRGWWNKDTLEKAKEETRMTEHERDIAEEDYEGRKDDQTIPGTVISGGTADYERDSEPPPKY